MKKETVLLHLLLVIRLAASLVKSREGPSQQRGYNIQKQELTTHLLPAVERTLKLKKKE